MKIKLILILTLLLSSNIAFASMEKTMTTIMDSWLGYSIDDAISQWGYPDNEKYIANRTLDYWYSRDYNGYTCTRILEVNDLGKIVDYQWEGVKIMGLVGGGCPAHLNLKYKKQWLNQKRNNISNNASKNKQNYTQGNDTFFTKPTKTNNKYTESVKTVETIEKNVTQPIKINPDDIVIPQLNYKKKQLE